MQAEVIHPETGEKYTLEMPNLRASDLDAMKQEYTTNEKLKSYIEQLSVSAETKLLLMKIAEFSISVGNTVIKMGKKILEMVIMLASKYKHAAFGMLLGALLASLIAAVPFLGPPLAGFFNRCLCL